MRQQRIAIALDVDGDVSRRVQVRAPNPMRWSEGDARAFVRSVWDVLEARFAESFQLREIQPWTVYRLKFVTDHGVAISQPLMLSRQALGWLQSATFGSGGDVLY